MTSVAVNEFTFAPTGRGLRPMMPVGSSGAMGNREKNLVSGWCERFSTYFGLPMTVYGVEIGGDLEGLHSLVRLATFNRDKNLITRVWAGWWS